MQYTLKVQQTSIVQNLVHLMFNYSHVCDVNHIVYIYANNPIGRGIRKCVSSNRHKKEKLFHTEV